MAKEPGVPALPSCDSDTETIRGAPQIRVLDLGPQAVVNDLGVDAPVSYRRGNKLGRFLIVDELGVGAMGVVVSAYDPDLDRKVAIKVLRSELAEGESASQGQQRLVREAQAMAKLSHPNVVTVFEVGTLLDRVFLAMEFIEGRTLSAWIKEESPSWNQVIDVFVQAGRGLAAAHAAGLVHRDFKPDNVLLRQDGTPCVADFGLASAAGVTVSVGDAAPNAVDVAFGDSAPSNMSLTKTGQLLGTPAYMSPEQISGKRVDARADQFSFCVALHEALYGAPPYEGSSLPLLCKSIKEGKVRPPSSNKVPKWIADVLWRGLRPDPADRYPNMEALLAALTSDPALVRQRSLLMATVAVAFLTVITTVSAFASKVWHDRPCMGVEDEMASVWNESTRSAVRKAFSATGSTEAEATFKRVDRAMSSYITEWGAMRKEVCEATFVSQQQSERLLDLRLQCLHRRKEEADAVVRLLARGPNRELLGNAVQVTMGVTPLSACADANALLAAVPPPEDPTVRTKVEALRTLLDHVAALNTANTTASFAEGGKIAEDVARQADGLPYLPIQAEALRWVGDMQYGRGDHKGAEMTFHRAMMAAAEARDGRLETVIMARLLRLMAYDQGRTQESLALVPLVEAATVRVKDDVLRGQVVFEHAYLLYVVGRVDDAQREAERALAITERTLGKDHADVAEIVDFIGGLLTRRGAFAEAVRYHQRAEVSMQRALGPGHSRVAEVLNNLCKAYKDAGQYDKGRLACERSITISVNALGAGYQGVGCTRSHLAEVLCGAGEFERGVSEARSARALLEKSVGPEHRWALASLTALGVCLLGAGKPKEALEPLQRSLKLREANPDLPIELAKTRFAMARALWASGGDKAHALSLAARAEQEYKKAPGAPPPELEAIHKWLAAHRRM